jgi:hypothetical protein
MIMNFLEIITIGLPFCAFKIVTGLFLNQPWITVLGVIDLGINLINSVFLLLLKRRVFDACLLSFLTRLLKKPTKVTKPKWQDLGNSIDVLLSFSLVAYMIGGGFIKDLPTDYLSIWNISVILNVFGAGFARLEISIRNLKN